MSCRKYKLMITESYINGHKMYFFTKNYNALYVIDLISKKCDLLGRIPSERRFSDELVEAVHYYNGKILLTPKKMQANKIWRYDIENKTWDDIEVDFSGIPNAQEKVAFSTIFGDELVIVGCYYNGLIKVNLLNDKISYYKELFDKKETIHSLSCCIVDEDYLCVPSPNNNLFYKLNLISMKCKEIILGENPYMYTGICRVNDSLWLSPRKKLQYITIVNDKNKIEQLKIPEEMLKNGEYIFSGIKRIGNKICLLAGANKKNLIYYEGDKTYKYEIVDSYAYTKSEKENYIIQEFDGKVSINWNDEKYDFMLEKNLDELCNEDNNKGFPEGLLKESSSVDIDMFIKMLS